MARKKRAGLLASLLALAVLCACLPGIGEESPYIENEWNYVDGAMDITNGIPKNAAGTLQRIRESGTLRVATSPDYPPQEFIDPARSGQESYVGSDMEMARYIAERMGVALKIVPCAFADVMDAVTEEQCDLAISALSYTPYRAALVELSKGYFYSAEGAGSGILIRQERQGEITGVESLKNRVIVAQSGSLQEMLAAENITDYSEFRRLTTMPEVYLAVISGRADAAIVDTQSAQEYINSNPGCGLTLLPDVHFVLEKQMDGDRIAGKKGDLELMYYINAIINELLESGQYLQWYEESRELAASLNT